MTYYEDVNNISAPVQAEENRIVNKSLSKLPEPYISGLKLNADVSLGSLQLNTIDNSGNVWVVTDITGWWNLPEPEMPDLPRGWGDGSYDAVGRYSARLITLNGTILTQDPNKVEAARQTLINAVSLVYEGAWLVVEETPAKAAFVRLSGQPQIRSVSARGRTDFSIGLKAANPIKYEWVDDDSDPTNNTTNAYNNSDISNGGTATITNNGNIKVPVVIQLEGPISASSGSPIIITNTTRSEVINVVDDIASGETLEIDTYNREALSVTSSSTLNARAKLSTLVSWIHLDPGDNTVEFSVSGDTGGSYTCRVLYRSGWIG